MIDLQIDQLSKGYKKTDVGVIPEDWEVKQLGEFCSFTQGIQIFQKHLAKERREGYIRYLYIRDFFKDDFPWFVKDIYPNKIMQKADIMMVNTGNTAGSVYSGGYGVLSNNAFSIGFDKKVTDRDFLFAFLKSSTFQLKLKNFFNTSGQPHVGHKNIAQMNMPLPQLPEQQAIAEVLSDVDALITSLDATLNKKRNVKQGTMQLLLTGKKRLPNFTGDWETKTLGEVVEVIGGGTPSTSVSKFWEGNINWFTPTEIGKYKYTFESKRKITKAGLISSSAKILPIGTLLLTSRAGIGDLSLLKKEGCTNQGFQSLLAKETIDSEFLYYLASTLKNTFIKNASGSTFLEISPHKIKQVEIKLPTKEEQKAIAQILSDMDAEIEALEAKRDKYKAIKQGMMQELLTGKIRLV